MPTEEEIEQHRIAPELVDELRAEAGCPTPRPDLPKPSRLSPAGTPMPELTTAPDDAEQLGLFGASS